ncbi:MAG: sulfate adenylyltransferase [Candidatus Omnitrophota bacterium]|nr:MAG: sulfate adenylyltransferase [Candidatus Omnitrophota bacterium]
MHKPHGGKLINRVLNEDERNKVSKKLERLYHLKLTEEATQDVFNITTGVYSPLEGFIGREDYINILDNRRLASGLPWTIPISLDVSLEEAKELVRHNEVCLLTPEAKPIALLHIKDIYEFDKQELALKVFGTTDAAHPGVRRVGAMKDRLVEGLIDLIDEPEHPFGQYTLKPLETRVLFEEKGWVDVVGFQTRNVPHLGHEYVQKTALAFSDGLFINPVIGRKKKGDFKDELILNTYETLINNYYLKEKTVMSVLNMQMRYAGPREAIFHAIIRKNFGCTHFIVGRDHAGVSNFYHPFAAHQIFEEFPDLEIVPLFFKSFFYCQRCGSVANEKTCPHQEIGQINFSGTEIRKLLQEGKLPSPELMRKEVAETIIAHKEPFVE